MTANTDTAATKTPTLQATFDFGDVELAKRMTAEAKAADGLQVVQRRGTKLTLWGERETLKGWLICLKMRSIVSGLRHANLHAELSQAREV